MDELKPCPFCGAAPELMWDEEWGYGGFVSCKTFNCAASGTGKHDKDSIIAGWNRRTAGDGGRE